MFTGIIEDTGTIKNVISKGSSKEFTVAVSRKSFFNKLYMGGSIAVNGTCITLEKISGGTFKFTAVKETLKKTNLGFLKTGTLINLEKPLKLGSGLDGHIVLGHVDTTGVVESFVNIKNGYELVIAFDGKYRDMVIYTGSICIDGISLTVAQIADETKSKTKIKIAIIPHTFKVTNVMNYSKGTVVNIEFDVLGKYIKRILNK